MATNKINAQILLRTDTFSNWFNNRNSTIANKELIVVKYDDGSYGFKIGSGNSYANTGFIKFQTLATNNITNGTYTYSLPHETGTLALKSDLPFDIITHQYPFDTETWIITEVEDPENYYVEVDYPFSYGGICVDARLFKRDYGEIATFYEIISGEVTQLIFNFYDYEAEVDRTIIAIKGYQINAVNRAFNIVVPYQESTENYVNLEIKAPDIILNKSREFIVVLDLSEFNANNLPVIQFTGMTIKNPVTLTNNFYILKFTEYTQNNFVINDLLVDQSISNLQSSVQSINNTIGNLETIINGI